MKKKRKTQIDEEAEARINLAYAMIAEENNPELKAKRVDGMWVCGGQDGAYYTKKFLEKYGDKLKEEQNNNTEL